MSKRYHFIQADVFTSKPFGGNQLAVFNDARGLSTGEMQTLAREMNFSVCTFVLPAEGEGGWPRVRIFTPGKELPTSGHPTVGTVFVLAQRGDIVLDGGRTIATLLLGVGPVRVTIEAEDGAPTFVWMVHRKPDFGMMVDARERVAAALGLDEEDVREDRPIQVISTGVPFLFVPLASRGAVARCRPHTVELLRLCADAKADGIFVYTSDVVSPAAAFHARSFPSPAHGIPEDPATGSAAAPFGAYVAHYGLLPHASELRFVVEQGIEMQRPSEIYVAVRTAGDEITNLSIGGRTVIVGEGNIFWE